MRAAEAYWQGRESLFDLEITKSAPRCLTNSLGQAIHEANIKTGRFPEGHGILAEHPTLKRFLRTVGPFYAAWKPSVEVETIAVEASERAKAALASLDDAAKAFNGHIKNDLASMKAASDRVQSEVAQMQQRYRAAQDLLTSPDFERAIANAERLAAALQAISALSTTQVSVAVFGGGKG